MTVAWPSPAGATCPWGRAGGIRDLSPHAFAGAVGDRRIEDCTARDPFRVVYVSVVSPYKHQLVVAEAVRRGCQVIVAAPPGSLVAEHAVGRDAVVLPSHTQDPLATAVMVLELLHGLGLAPQVGSDAVADALDDVAVACSPFRDASVNPAKSLATGIADTSPLLWGASVLAARAARRVAESVRRTTGRAALAADAEHLFPVLESTPTHDVFADPFADPESAPRPSLVVFDDGFEEPQLRATRSALLATAERRGVRVETVTSQADGEVARYAALLATGQFAATYLGLGFAD